MGNTETVELADDHSRRGLGLFAAIAILSILGIIIWLVVNGDDDSA